MGLKTPMRCPPALPSLVSTPSEGTAAATIIIIINFACRKIPEMPMLPFWDAAPGTEGGRERAPEHGSGMCGDVRSERTSPAASVRPPLGGLGAIVGAIADMRGMDGGIWHERKGEHGKGAFLGEATVQSKCVVPPRTRFHPSCTGLPSQVEKEGPKISTLRAVSTVAKMPNRGGPDSEN